MVILPTRERRIDILGCPVDCISFKEVVETIRLVVRQRKRLVVATANVDFVMKARRDVAFCKQLHQADLVVADGVPVVWAGSILQRPLAGRVNGTDLVSECARLSSEDQFTVALVGAAPGVAARAAENLRRQYPAASIAVVDTPERLTEESACEVAAAARMHGPSIVLVALGAPRQEEWVQRYLDATGAAVGIGIGSALDILSGDKPRAPKWMQTNGLEWLHRMFQDPSRLVRRYMLDDSPFLFILAREALRIQTNRMKVLGRFREGKG